MLQDAVVAQIPETSVCAVLTAIHMAGFGHVSRMIRGGRRPVLNQLQRAGIPITQAPEGVQRSDAVLLVTAAARSPLAASLLVRNGADLVWTVSQLGGWTVTDDAIVAKPNVHVLPPHPGQRVPGLNPGIRLPTVDSVLVAADPIDEGT